MRIQLPLAALVAGLLAFGPFAAPAAAQNDPGANASRFGIAVVDINYIFKNHQRFKGTMDGLKAKVEGAETEMKQLRDRIGQMDEKLKQFKAGSPEYKALDDEITRAKAEFSIQANNKRKEFLDQEARIYYQTYLEVYDAVKVYSQRNNIGVVLRFNGDSIDPNVREEVLRAVNKPIVFENSVDITPAILQSVNRSGGIPGGGNPAAAIPGRPAAR